MESLVLQGLALPLVLLLSLLPSLLHVAQAGWGIE